MTWRPVDIRFSSPSGLAYGHERAEDKLVMIRGHDDFWYVLRAGGNYPNDLESIIYSPSDTISQIQRLIDERWPVKAPITRLRLLSDI